VTAFARSLAVRRLRPMLAAVDHKNTVTCHPAASQRSQPAGHVLGKRSVVEVDAQFDSRRHLVHVLTARTRGAHEPFLDLPLVNDDVAVDADHL